MKDKFCFSKTLTYLVLLVAVVVGTFYTINYVNQKKVTTDSEAASNVGSNSFITVRSPIRSNTLPETKCDKYGFYEVLNTASARIKDFCKNLNSGKYEYGGGWGSNAICYSNTKTCTTDQNSKLEMSLRCLNERVDVINCVNAKVAPTNTLSPQVNCPPDGKKRYGWGEGNKCYILNGLSQRRNSGEPYCANAVVPDIFCCNAGLYQPSKCVRPPTPTASVNKPKNCLPLKCRDTSLSYLDLTYYYMNTRYYSNDKCSTNYDITYKGVGNYCKGL